MVEVAGFAATMGIQNTSFVANATASLGTNTMQVKATDYANNRRTNTYEIVITNNGFAKTLSYDSNGNLTNAVSATSTNKYEWDAADRLIKITQLLAGNPQLVSEFSYDGMGRRARIVEKTNGVTQSDNRFLWCDTELCEERDSTGASVSKRFFGGGEEISGAPYFLTADHLGSIREMTDTNGAVQARYEFDPYGRRTKVSGSLDAKFAFTGHASHEPSGLNLAPYRGYDPDIARWISRDPIEEIGGVNLYAYVQNDPLNWIDLLGENRVSVFKLPKGYSGAVDQWNVGSSVDFEIHIKNKQGREVALVKSNGHWDSEHKGQILRRPSQIPRDVKREINRQVRTRSRAARAAGVLGLIALLVNAEASAAEMVETMKTIAKDCQNGQDDWAYVGLLTLRHEVNQQTGFMGDVVMRQMMRQMEGECKE